MRKGIWKKQLKVDASGYWEDDKKKEDAQKEDLKEDEEEEEESKRKIDEYKCSRECLVR